MTTIKKERKEVLITNLTHSIKKEIDTLFPTATQLHLEKIYFLIYLINKYKLYQIHIKNHEYALSFIKGDLSKILASMLEVGIIIKAGEYKKGKVSNSFSLKTPYLTTEDDFKIRYNPEDRKIPVWVERFVADHWTVKGKAFSEYTPEQSKDQIIENLNNKVKELESIIEEMNNNKLKPLIKRETFTAPASLVATMLITPSTPEVKEEEVTVVECSTLCVDNNTTLHTFKGKPLIIIDEDDIVVDGLIKRIINLYTPSPIRQSMKYDQILYKFNFSETAEGYEIKFN